MEKIKVIIAEDEPPIARFIKMLTEQEDDFLVTAICENGEDALKEVENSPARLLITDIRMLGMDGLELIRRIRQKNQEIKILIISGYKMFEYAREAIRLGIEDYITKPIEPEEFAEALDRVRRHYTREDRLDRQFRLEKALKNKDGKAWVENVPGELLEVMNIYQSGDANENIPFHVRMMEDIYILNYKDSLLYLRCMEEGMENGKTIGRLRKIMDLQHGRTVVGVLIREMKAGEENIGQIRELYRHVRKLAVPGKKVTEDYENIAMLKPTKGAVGDELLKKVKMDIEADSRKQFMEDFRKLFNGWEQKKAADSSPIAILLRFISNSVSSDECFSMICSIVSQDICASSMAVRRAGSCVKRKRAISSLSVYFLFILSLLPSSIFIVSIIKNNIQDSKCF